ncbi:MAG: ABC transporter permease [Puniceicoccales bacterium]|jgi:oligopeptide transport system permease protein|nr:ABC transporter permease [Puniceicoccales bacterium]
MIAVALLRRFIGTCAVLLAVLTAIFAMLRAVPGGPFDCERELPREAQAVIRANYDPQLPLMRQYIQYISRILHGDLGPSYRHCGWSVNELLFRALPVSFELGAYAMLLAISTGILWGCRASRKPFCGSDAASTFLICIPTFVLGPVLGHIFAHKLHWFNAMGWCGWKSKILPTITLAAPHAAFVARLTRRSMLAEYARPYVRTAHAKGLREVQVFWRHIFLNGMQPVIAYLGPTCAAVLSGTFVAESVFHIPGMGKLFIESIGNRDYTLITGIVLVYAILIVLCNFIADSLLLWIAPRR